MKNYDQIVCFTGAHLFHSIIGLAAGLIFVFICLTVCSCFFEIRIKSENIMARFLNIYRSDSSSEVIFILNKIVMLISFVFFTN